MKKLFKEVFHYYFAKNTILIHVGIMMMICSGAVFGIGLSKDIFFMCILSIVLYIIGILVLIYGYVKMIGD